MFSPNVTLPRMHHETRSLWKNKRRRYPSRMQVDRKLVIMGSEKHWQSLCHRRIANSLHAKFPTPREMHLPSNGRPRFAEPEQASRPVNYLANLHKNLPTDSAGDPEEGERSCSVIFPTGTWRGDDRSIVEGPCEQTIEGPLSRPPWNQFSAYSRSCSRSSLSPAGSNEIAFSDSSSSTCCWSIRERSSSSVVATKIPTT